MTSRPTARRYAASLLALVLFFGAAGVATAQSVAFGGPWETTYGLLEIVQDESGHALGTYTLGGGSTIEGRVDGNRLTFRYQEPDAVGEGWFEMAADGRTFTGQWREDGSASWYPWVGERSARAALVFENRGFSGLFDSTYGRMRLVARDGHVTGGYTHAGGSTVEGTVEGNRLAFRYREPDATGEGWFELSADGESLTGAWRAEGSASWGQWTARRIHPDPQRVWLVVLEAPWEESLAEREYAFGEMLRSYFQRMPQVEVRHRRMYDVADFERAMGELGYLGEPVALLVASHGIEGQLILSGERVRAEHFRAGLAQAPNVFLLHFSSCDMMTNGMPEALRANLPPGRSLAISGYTTFVDWSASALIEFLYLDLVLGRGLSPRQAAEVVRREMRFSGDEPDPYSPLGGAGFRFVE
jgi:hypothetical protein